MVILDIMLPGLSGLELLRRRRRLGDHAAIVMLSARGEEEDRLVGLETGADDYVVKPFSPRELVLRVEALLRRAERLGNPPLLSSTITVGPLTIDTAAREAQLNGEPLSLTTREFDLLAFLAGHAGQTFSKEELLRRVWGWDFGDTSTVTVHVRRLREKVEADPSDPRLVLTVGRAGYRLSRADEVSRAVMTDLMIIIALTVAACLLVGAGGIGRPAPGPAAVPALSARDRHPAPGAGGRRHRAWSTSG